MLNYFIIAAEKVFMAGHQTLPSHRLHSFMYAKSIFLITEY